MKTFIVHNNKLYVTHSTYALIGKSWVHNRNTVVRGRSCEWWWTEYDCFANTHNDTPARMYFGWDTCKDLEEAYQKCLTQLIIEE